MDNYLLSINLEKAKSKVKKLQMQITELESFIESTERYNPQNFEEKMVMEL